MFQFVKDEDGKQPGSNGQVPPIEYDLYFCHVCWGSHMLKCVAAVINKDG